MRMKTKWPPDPAETIARIAEPIRLINEALTFGADEGVKHHETRKREVDPWMYAHVVRDDAKHYMLNGGIEAMGFEVAKIANSGVFLRSEHIYIRVLKSAQVFNPMTGKFERGVPVPGSQLRREYFHQTSLPFSVPMLIPIEMPLKLVVLWEQDDLHQLGGLELACPKQWSASRNCVDTYWLVPLDVTAADFGLSGLTEDEPILLEDLQPREAADGERAASNDS